MQISDIVLRNKSLSLINSPVQPMGIEVENLDSKILNNERKNTIFLLKGINLRITNKKNNIPIAEFKLFLQCKVLLSENEGFSETKFTQELLPAIFMQMNNMLGEISLPRISYEQFYDFMQERN